MSKAFRTALVGTSYNATTHDDALDASPTDPDKTAEHRRLIEEFAKNRPDVQANGCDESGARILPVKSGAELTLFKIEPLTPASLAWCMDTTTGEARYQRAFLCGCHEIQAPGSQPLRANVTRAGGTSVADDEWLTDAFATYGQHAINEIGKVVIERAHLGPKARGGYSLPSGLTLPR